MYIVLLLEHLPKKYLPYAINPQLTDFLCSTLLFGQKIAVNCQKELVYIIQTLVQNIATTLNLDPVENLSCSYPTPNFPGGSIIFLPKYYILPTPWREAALQWIRMFLFHSPEECHLSQPGLDLVALESNFTRDSLQNFRGGSWSMLRLRGMGYRWKEGEG